MWEWSSDIAPFIQLHRWKSRWKCSSGIGGSRWSCGLLLVGSLLHLHCVHASLSNDLQASNNAVCIFGKLVMMWLMVSG